MRGSACRLAEKPLLDEKRTLAGTATRKPTMQVDDQVNISGLDEEALDSWGALTDGGASSLTGTLGDITHTSELENLHGIKHRYGYRFVKRTFDIVASFCGIVLLSPFFLAVAIAVKATSRGPVILKQKRYGKNQIPFILYKFRTMVVDTPLDIPTREMNENRNYMTPIGPFLRKTSIDELPQFFNILSGKMSVIGPRPVILKETDQIVARDRYGANNIRPGLTGWAQVNGRDAVGVEEKAHYDGEYCERMSIVFDAKCFIHSLVVVLTGEGFGDAIVIKEAEKNGENLDELFVNEMISAKQLTQSADGKKRQ